MKVYSYSWDTGEYIGEAEADVSPLDPGNFLIPAFATTKVPPDINEFPGSWQYFDREKDEWVIEKKRSEVTTPPTITEQLAQIPTDSLLGDQTIGDLFK
jgi:hypothetical protein